MFVKKKKFERILRPTCLGCFFDLSLEGCALYDFNIICIERMYFEDGVYLQGLSISISTNIGIVENRLNSTNIG